MPTDIDEYERRMAVQRGEMALERAEYAAWLASIHALPLIERAQAFLVRRGHAPAAHEHLRAIAAANPGISAPALADAFVGARDHGMLEHM